MPRLVCQPLSLCCNFDVIDSLSLFALFLFPRLLQSFSQPFLRGFDPTCEPRCACCVPAPNPATLFAPPLLLQLSPLFAFSTPPPPPPASLSKRQTCRASAASHVPLTARPAPSGLSHTHQPLFASTAATAAASASYSNSLPRLFFSYQPLLQCFRSFSLALRRCCSPAALSPLSCSRHRRQPLRSRVSRRWAPSPRTTRALSTTTATRARSAASRSMRTATRSCAATATTLPTA